MPDSPPTIANNSSLRHPRRPRLPPNRIPTGHLYGLPKRPAADRKARLQISQVIDATNALEFARLRRTPLNAAITVTWRLAKGFDPDAPEAWAAFQTRFFDKLGRWLLRAGVIPAYVWTREQNYGKGAHTHALVALGGNPAETARALKKYLDASMGFAPAGIQIDVRGYGLKTPKMQAGFMTYMLKDLDHSAFRYIGMAGETENIGDALGIDHRGTAHPVSVKRQGCSENLARKARKAANWIDVRELHALRRMLHPTEAGARPI